MQALITPKKAAELLSVTPARVYQLCRSGALPSLRMGRQIRLNPDALEAWIAAGGSPLPGGWKREPSE